MHTHVHLHEATVFQIHPSILSKCLCSFTLYCQCSCFSKLYSQTRLAFHSVTISTRDDNMYMYMYMYLYTCTCTCVYMYVYTSTIMICFMLHLMYMYILFTSFYTHMHMHMYMYVHACGATYVYMCSSLRQKVNNYYIYLIGKRNFVCFPQHGT